MIQVIWAFVVKADAVKKFLEAYGPDGVWARLFRAYPGYRGTTLLRDMENPLRYLTVDLWDTQADRDQMLAEGEGRYADLDEALADLTDSEDEIGIFVVPARTRPASRRRRVGKQAQGKDGGVKRASRRTRG